MDHRRILKWADRQCEILKPDIERFEKDQPNRLISDRDSATGDYIVRFDKTVLQPVDDDWIFQVGDILHNMRASLDYLTFSIVKPTDTTEIEKTQFPILRRERTNWDSLVGHRIPTVSEQARDAFKDLQPKYGADADDFPHPLSFLDSLENIHKHRHPLAAQPLVKTAGASFWTGAVDMSKARFGLEFGALNDRPVVFRLPLKPDDPEPKVQIHASVKVCFDVEGPAQGMAVILLLEHISHYIRQNVFPKLEPFVQ